MSNNDSQNNQNKENSPQRSDTNQVEPQGINQDQKQQSEKKEIPPNFTQVEQIGQEDQPLIEFQVHQNERTNTNFNQSQKGKSQADFRKSIYMARIEEQINSPQSFFQKINKKEKQSKKCCEVCCLPIGSHTFCCGSQNTRPHFKQFGVGVNLYFRFLKKLGYFFIIFTIFSIPQLFFSVLSYVGSEARDSSNPFEFLMATTIGATSLNNKDCQIQSFDSNYTPIEFNLKCDSGNLAGPSFLYGVISSNEQDCIYISKAELNLNITNQDRLNLLRQEIDSQDEYSFTLTQSDFNNEDIKGMKIFAGAQCKDAKITIGPIQLQQKIIPIIFASCDAVIVLLFIYFLICLTASEKKYTKISQKESPTLQHFSLQISNLPKCEELIRTLQKQENKEYKQIKQQLLQEVKNFIDQKLKSVLKDQDLQIYDIQVSEKEKILKLQSELKHKKQMISNQLEELRINKSQCYQEAQQHINEQIMSKETYQKFYQYFLHSCEDPNYQQNLIKIDKIIQKHWIEIDELSQKIDQIQSEGDSKYIWVTFDTMRQKQQVQEQLQSLPKDWLYYYCCFCCFDEDEKKNKLLLKKFKLQIKDAPIPENINWNNLNYSLKQRIMRQFCSFFITLVLLAGSWVLVSWVNLQKTDFQQKYPSINCNNKIYDNITEDQVQQEIDDDGSIAIKGYVECYCKPKFNEILQGQYEICQDWVTQYTFQQSLPWIIVGGLIGVNVIIQYIFIFLSQWEKHLMISQEYSSRILKIFLGQFLNTGLILLITNIDFGNSARNDAPETIRFLFGGKYADIDSKWCQNIGIVLLLTLLINILTQPVMLLVEIIIRYIRQAYDQSSCCLNQKKTKKKNYQEFKDLYKGEQFRVELRYAQVLTALYICFMYTPALPFLYFITMLTIWFLYFVDKISIFTTYRKPIRIDSIISESVRKYLWIAVVIHLGFATYIYGSSNLFYETLEAKLVIDQLQDVYGQQNVVVEWWDRSWSQIPNIILLAILAILILIIFLFFFCYKPVVGLFSKCFACCNDQIKKNNSNGLELQEQRPFLKFLKKEQIDEDLKFTQFQMMLAPSVYKEKYLKLMNELQIPIGINNNEIPIMNQDIRIEQLPLAQSQIKQSALTQNENQQQNSQNRSNNQNAISQSQVNRSKTELNQIQNNQQKLIGLRSYHKAYNKQYHKYYEWDEIKAINTQ
ncbi:unnamed protein product [Paramecium primaurelia]|uniref:CSC1/OSCA1-like cytosolic domain-containing protein n=1 Tax=Paramecium primaurelia TaxID=5886 RepID=A0A8S1M8P5_PARPR|nr:unnamed protein product [Paramecium primaurelia]